jgi:hypothetical protein
VVGGSFAVAAAIGSAAVWVDEIDNNLRKKDQPDITRKVKPQNLNEAFLSVKKLTTTRVLLLLLLFLLSYNCLKLFLHSGCTLFCSKDVHKFKNKISMLKGSTAIQFVCTVTE